MIYVKTKKFKQNLKNQITNETLVSVLSCKELRSCPHYKKKKPNKLTMNNFSQISQKIEIEGKTKTSTPKYVEKGK